MALVFDCRMCGHCCQGRGGIILSPGDLARAASGLGLPEAEFAARFAEKRNGKLSLKSSGSGYCLFFVEGRGCSIHSFKPDVCRAWPYFRGNMVDAESLELAKEYCPGLRRGASHAEFYAEGLDYLRANRLFRPKRGGVLAGAQADALADAQGGALADALPNALMEEPEG